MNKQKEQKIREELFYDCLEDLVLTAELGHRAIDQKAHKDEIRGYINKTGDFLISKIKQREEEIMQTAFRFDTEQFNSYDDYKDTIIRNTNR